MVSDRCASEMRDARTRPGARGRLRRRDVRHHRCANDERSPTKQRYSVRLTAPEDVNGRSTARRMDVNFTEVVRGCSLSSVARRRGVVARQPQGLSRPRPGSSAP
jgi:hypothetical protein